jgi:hypothetical protein
MPFGFEPFIIPYLRLQLFLVLPPALLLFSTALTVLIVDERAVEQLTPTSVNSFFLGLF